MNNIKIKCPYCGSVLLVKPPLSGKAAVVCPVCKERSPFNSFRKVEEQKEEKTEFTELNAKVGQKVIGRLRVLGLNIPPFDLKMGKNVIGRKSDASSADIQIPIAGNRRMSRNHLIIEVKNVQGKGIVHYVSLCKQQVNATYINNERIEYGDCLVLNDGDLIGLPDADVKFEIVDNS